MTKQLMETLAECATKFRSYADLHMAKGTEEGKLKAETNLEMAEKCLMVIAAHQGIDFEGMDKLRGLSVTLAALALNGAHGAVFERFEIDQTIELAAKVGVRPGERQARMLANRRILNEIAAERVKQIDIFGYTADRDDANPEKLHKEIMDRVLALPHPEQRKPLVEAAAIIIAEIESIDRRSRSSVAADVATETTAPLETLHAQV